MRDILQKAAQIKLALFDVDGVLTDGSLFVDNAGEEYKAFYSRDGLGMRMLQSSGVELGVITGRTSNVVINRMESLDIKHIYQGCTDKLPAYEKIKQDLGLDDGQIAFIGDDVVDVPVLQQAGLAIAVADAHPLLMRYTHWRTPSRGGRGAARDVCELIMQAQQTWESQLRRFHIEVSV